MNKKYTVTIDVVDSFNCEIEAKSEVEALEKAKTIDPTYKNVPHWRENRVIGITDNAYDGE